LKYLDELIAIEKKKKKEREKEIKQELQLPVSTGEVSAPINTS
jgi:hypothetical protein